MVPWILLPAAPSRLVVARQDTAERRPLMTREQTVGAPEARRRLVGGMPCLFEAVRSWMRVAEAVFIAAFLLAAPGCSSPPNRPAAFADTAWRQLSPSVGASWFAQQHEPVNCSAGLEPLRSPVASPPQVAPAGGENRESSAMLEVLVLWRGTPGWFLEPGPGGGSSVSFDSGAFYPRPGRDASRPAAGGVPAGGRLGSSVSIHQGRVRLELRFEPESATVYVQEHPVSLHDDNVVLVDDVDDSAGPRVAGTLRIDPRFAVRCLDEPPYLLDGVETLLQRSEGLRAFLRCDMPLPADLYPDSRSVSRTQRHMDEACARLDPATGEPGR